MRIFGLSDSVQEEAVFGISDAVFANLKWVTDCSVGSDPGAIFISLVTGLANGNKFLLTGYLSGGLQRERLLPETDVFGRVPVVEDEFSKVE